MVKCYYIYLLSNTSRMIYIGVTNDLERRIYEETDDIGRALEREKQLKGGEDKRK